MKSFLRLAFSPIILLALSPTAFAQAKPEILCPPVISPHVQPEYWDKQIPDCRLQETRTKQSACREARYHEYTYYLQNASQQNDGNEILVAIRNIFDPSIKFFLAASQQAIGIGSYPEEYARIVAFIKTLDLPHRRFRITYTVTDMDGDKRVGTQHFSMSVADGQRSTLKQGSKIPVATGKVDDGKGTPGSIQTSFTYLDVGINLDATISASPNGLTLKSKVELSSVAPEPVVIAGVSEPIIRQSVFDQVAILTLGKPTILGSVDLPGTTHRLDVAASIEPLP